MRSARNGVPVVLLLIAAAGGHPAAAQSMKATQKAIRERVLTEAGSDQVIYSRVDFSDCAMTIQSRTPKAEDGSETRWTHTVHGTSLDSGTTVDSGAAHWVAVRVKNDTAAIRLVSQTIAKGRVSEATQYLNRLDFRFQRKGTASALAAAFNHLESLCGDQPFAGAGR